MPETHIRVLTREDGAMYQQLRLESLLTNPEAFLSSYETESNLHESAFADHLDWSYHPPVFGYYGVFIENQLVGYVQISKNYLDKQRHIVNLNNLYISKSHRQLGLATLLIDHVVKQLQQHEHIERVFLTCTARNTRAYSFYKKLGFRRYAVKSRAIKWGDEYDDEIEMVKLLSSSA